MTADPYAASSSSAPSDAAHRPYHEVTDARGRVCRIGETDRDILGHSRKIMVYLPGWLPERGILTARRAMYLGSGMYLLGFLALSHLNNVLLAILGFGVIGGLGAGLVYATCINVVGQWFPERRGARAGFVNGGFAYGSLPFIFIFIYGSTPRTTTGCWT